MSVATIDTGGVADASAWPASIASVYASSPEEHAATHTLIASRPSRPRGVEQPVPVDRVQLAALAEEERLVDGDLVDQAVQQRRRPPAACPAQEGGGVEVRVHPAQGGLERRQL